MVIHLFVLHILINDVSIMSCSFQKCAHQVLLFLIRLILAFDFLMQKGETLEDLIEHIIDLLTVLPFLIELFDLLNVVVEIPGLDSKCVF